MKAVYFIFSQEQRNVGLDFEPTKEVNQVFVNGSFVPYTEINDTGKSNFPDAKCLGVHPRGWVKCRGVIQDSDLAEFVNSHIKT